LVVVFICLISLPLVVNSSNEIADGYIYHSTLYYDATNPYNYVFGNETHAYQCYIDSNYTGSANYSTLKPIIFVHDGAIVKNSTVTRDLLKIYFSQYCRTLAEVEESIQNCKEYIEISKGLKLNEIVKDVGSAAAKSLGTIASIYLTGDVTGALVSVDYITKIVATKTVEELTDHVGKVAQIIADAQLTYFHLTVLEMALNISAIETITDFTSFENCEKYTDCVENIYKARKCARELVKSIAIDLEKSDEFLEVLAQFTLDVGKGFVGEFSDFLVTYDKLDAIHKQDPQFLSKTIKLAAFFANCEKTVDEYGKVLVEATKFQVGDYFTVVKAYEARENAITPMNILEKVHRIGLIQHGVNDLDTDDSGEIEQEEPLARGTCGAYSDNLTWVVTKNGELIISGSGLMNSYSSENEVPWYSYRSSIKNIIIGSGVTNIGARAFSRCSNIPSVSIPSSVTSIGTYAFDSCSSLASVALGGKVRNIGAYAFHDCSSLVGITIPNSVTNIDWNAFEGCSALKSVTIGNGVTSIGASAFSECSSLTGITIPDSVTNIDSFAFYGCSSLVNVVMGDSVKSIGSGTFNGCWGLKGVYVKDIANWCGISFVGDTANPLYYAKNLYLNGLLVENLTVPDGVTEIRNNAFYNCTSLVALTLPNSMISIKEYAFANCSALSEIVLSESLTDIGVGAFSGCSALSKITIPESVTNIGQQAFSHCLSLKNLYIADIKSWLDIKRGDANANPLYAARDGHLYVGGALVSDLVIPEGVTSIGGWAFSGCSSLEKVKIPDSVTRIETGAFNGCFNLLEITIPDSVVSMGGSAFNECSSLVEIAIPKSVTIIESAIFKNCTSLFEITIPEGVTHVGDSAFNGCISLWKITIPDSVTSIGASAFENCFSLFKINIPENVKSIGMSAFQQCSNLKKVTLGVGLTSIYEYAFSHCVSLEEITIPDSVKDIYHCAFYGCSSLVSVEIGNGVTRIDDALFYQCSSLEKILIPEKITSIGSGAFDGCPKLAGVYITNLGSWCGIVFEGNNSNPLYYAHDLYLDGELVTELVIPEGITRIGDIAFEGALCLEKITIPESVVTVGDCAFFGCRNLEKVMILSPTTNILGDEGTLYFADTVCGYAGSTTEAYAKKYSENFVEIMDHGECGVEDSNLIWVLTADGVLDIGGKGKMAVREASDPSWYAHCDSIKEVMFGKDLTSIDSHAFSCCENLSAIRVLNGNSVYRSEGNCLIETKNKGLVLGCKSSLVPENVEIIYAYAFNCCTNLVELSIPESVTIIEHNAFDTCVNLAKLTVLSRTVEIDDSEYTIYAGTTIYGYANSTAEAYATKYGRRFVALEEPADADFISYQVSKGENGTFSLRAIAGLNSLDYANFGYEVTVATKDENGNDVVKTLFGATTKAYSSIYGGDTEYSIKEHFGYEYAGLATVTGLAVDSEYTKLEIRSYVTTLDGEVKYGKSATLLYTGMLDENEFPTLELVTE